MLITGRRERLKSAEECWRDPLDENEDVKLFGISVASDGVPEFSTAELHATLHEVPEVTGSQPGGNWSCSCGFDPLAFAKGTS